jgi:hypothetical protein
MSNILNNYKKNKLIFNNFINQKYKIKKDPFDKDIIIISSKDKQIKCKYILFLIENKLINKNNKNSENDNILNSSIIIWSDSNPYIDIYTREISEIIRNMMLKEKSYLINQNNQIIVPDDLTDMISTLIKNQYYFVDKNNKNIFCEWILINDTNNNIVEYYMIIDIIYY